MWDLRTLKNKNDEWVDRMAKNWRGSVQINTESDIDKMYSFPYYDPEIERKVFFASNLGELLPVPERLMGQQLKKVLTHNGSFTVSLHSSSRYEVRLVLWIG
jgi:hypothetical protein